MQSWDETVSYLYALLPAYQRTGDAASVRFDLSRTHELLDSLGNPELYLAQRSIHVAGTNGKGSVSSMLAAILTTAGFRTGLYTSPHLRCFTERMRIDGQPVDRRWVMEFVNTHQTLIETLRPTFFELTVGMAFCWFRDQSVDFAVIEVGMGGRLDSTNVIDPLLCIITNIGLEHTEFLGNTRAKIAAEKGGIIKANTPVVIGEKDEEITSVFKVIAAERNAPIYWAPDTWTGFSMGLESLDGSTLENVRFDRNDGRMVALLESDLIGAYQIPNLASVLTAFFVLENIVPNLKSNALIDGLKQVRKKSGLRGRFDVCGSNPTVVLDVTHNAPGLKLLVQQVLRFGHIDRQQHWVIGMVQKPEWIDFLQLLPAKDHYYWVAPSLPRARAVAELQAAAAELGLVGLAWPSVADGLAAAKAAAAPSDLIIVTGSTFVVADALDYLEPLEQ